MDFDSLYKQMAPHLRRRLGLDLLDQPEAEAALTTAPVAPIPVGRVQQMLTWFRAASEPVVFRFAVRVAANDCPEGDFLCESISHQITVVLAVMATRGTLRF
jgi:hypothetical protein